MEPAHTTPSEFDQGLVDVLQKRLSVLEGDLSKERKHRSELERKSDIAIAKSISREEKLKTQHAGDMEMLNASYIQLASNAVSKGNAMNSLALRCEELNKEVHQQTDLNSSLEVALEQTSRTLARSRADENLLMSRIRGLEEHNSSLINFVRKMGDNHKVAVAASCELAQALEKVAEYRSVIERLERSARIKAASQETGDCYEHPTSPLSSCQSQESPRKTHGSQHRDADSICPGISKGSTNALELRVHRRELSPTWDAWSHPEVKTRMGSRLAQSHGLRRSYSAHALGRVPRNDEGGDISIEEAPLSGDPHVSKSKSSFVKIEEEKNALKQAIEHLSEELQDKSLKLQDAEHHSETSRRFMARANELLSRVTLGFGQCRDVHRRSVKVNADFLNAMSVMNLMPIGGDAAPSSPLHLPKGSSGGGCTQAAVGTDGKQSRNISSNQKCPGGTESNAIKFKTAELHTTAADSKVHVGNMNGTDFRKDVEVQRVSPSRFHAENGRLGAFHGPSQNQVPTSGTHSSSTSTYTEHETRRNAPGITRPLNTSIALKLSPRRAFSDVCEGTCRGMGHARKTMVEQHQESKIRVFVAEKKVKYMEEENLDLNMRLVGLQYSIETETKAMKTALTSDNGTTLNTDDVRGCVDMRLASHLPDDESGLKAALGSIDHSRSRAGVDVDPQRKSACDVSLTQHRYGRKNGGENYSIKMHTTNTKSETFADGSFRENGSRRSCQPCSRVRDLERKLFLLRKVNKAMTDRLFQSFCYQSHSKFGRSVVDEKPLKLEDMQAFKELELLLQESQEFSGRISGAVKAWDTQRRELDKQCQAHMDVRRERITECYNDPDCSKRRIMELLDGSAHDIKCPHSTSAVPEFDFDCERSVNVSESLRFMMPSPPARGIAISSQDVGPRAELDRLSSELENSVSEWIEDLKSNDCESEYVCEIARILFYKCLKALNLCNEARSQLEDEVMDLQMKLCVTTASSTDHHGGDDIVTSRALNGAADREWNNFRNELKHTATCPEPQTSCFKYLSGSACSPLRSSPFHRDARHKDAHVSPSLLQKATNVDMGRNRACDREITEMKEDYAAKLRESESMLILSKDSVAKLQKELSASNADMQETVSRLSVQLEESVSEKRNIRTTLGDRVQELTKNLHVAENARDNLRRDLSTERSNRQNEKELIQKQILDKEHSAAHQRALIDGQYKELEDKVRKLDESQSLCSSLQADASRLHDTVASMKADIKQKTTQMSLQLENEQAERQQTESALNQRVQDLQSQLQAAESRRTATERDLDMGRTEMQTTKKALQQKLDEEEASGLEQAALIDYLQRKCDEKQRNLDDYQGRCNILQGDVEKLEEHLAGARGELENTKTRLSVQMEKSQTERQQVETALEEKVRSLQSKLQEAESRRTATERDLDIGRTEMQTTKEFLQLKLDAEQVSSLRQKERFEDLQKECDEQSRKLDESQGLRTALEADVSRLEDTVASMKADIKQKTTQMSLQLENEQAERQQTESALNQRVQDLQSQLQAAESRRTATERDLDMGRTEMQTTKKALQQKLDEEEASGLEQAALIDYLQRKCDEKQRNLDDYQGRCNILQGDVEKLEEHLAGARGELENTKTRLSVQMEKSQTERQQVETALEEKVRSLQSKLQEAESRRTATERDLDIGRTEMQTTKEFLQLKLDAEQVSSLRQKERFEDLQKECDEQSRKLDESQGLRTALEADVSRLEDTVASMKADIKQKTTQMSLQLENEQAERQQTESALNQRVQDLQSQLQAAESRRTATERDLDMGRTEMQTTKKALQQKLDEEEASGLEQAALIDYLQRKCDEKQRNLDDYQGRCNILQGDVEKLEEHLAGARGELENTKTRLSVQMEKSQTERQQVETALEEKVRSLQSKLQEAESRRTATERDLDIGRTEMQTTKEFLQLKLDAEQVSSLRQKERFEDLQKECDEQSRKLDESQGLRTALEADVSRLEDTVASMKADIKQKTTQMSLQLENEQAERQQTESALNQRVQDLQSQLQAAESRRTATERDLDMGRTEMQTTKEFLQLKLDAEQVSSLRQKERFEDLQKECDEQSRKLDESQGLRISLEADVSRLQQDFALKEGEMKQATVRLSLQLENAEIERRNLETTFAQKFQSLEAELQEAELQRTDEKRGIDEGNRLLQSEKESVENLLRSTQAKQTAQGLLVQELRREVDEASRKLLESHEARSTLQETVLRIEQEQGTTKAQTQTKIARLSLQLENAEMEQRNIEKALTGQLTSLQEEHEAAVSNHLAANQDAEAIIKELKTVRQNLKDQLQNEQGEVAHQQAMIDGLVKERGGLLETTEKFTMANAELMAISRTLQWMSEAHLDPKSLEQGVPDAVPNVILLQQISSQLEKHKTELGELRQNRESETVSQSSSKARIPARKGTKALEVSDVSSSSKSTKSVGRPWMRRKMSEISREEMQTMARCTVDIGEGDPAVWSQQR